jgi:type IV pilus assembly protein PilO
MSSRKFNIKELDFNNIGAWPLAARAVFCGLMGLLVIVLSWFLLTSGKRDELIALEGKEVELRDTFKTTSERAANLEPLKEQLALLSEQLKTVLRQLPSKTEMPDLITDISQTAQGTGVNTELFQPNPEQVQEFYAEKPIAVRMVGSYHQFGNFVSGVASLPRMVIMTMQDVTLAPRKGDKVISAAPGVPLELVTTIKTYRYLDEKETEEQEALSVERAAEEKKSQAKPKAEAPADNKEGA